MRSDGPIARNVIDDFDAIRKAKRKQRRQQLDLLRDDVLDRYVAYWLARGQLETLTPKTWTSAEDDALRHCYGGTNQARDAVMAAIEKALIPTPYLCPYCLMRQPKSIDHFLPQEAFPEFSVLAWNLILVCETCNRRKSNRLYNPPRSVLNPYFDPIPQSPLLHAMVQIGPKRITLGYFVQSNDPSVTTSFLAMAQRHLHELRLSKDLIREGTSYIATIVNSITAEHASPIAIERLNSILDTRMRGLCEFPTNSWQVAVVEALEECPDFLGYVNDRIASMPRPERARPRRDLTALRIAAAALGQA